MTRPAAPEERQEALIVIAGHFLTPAAKATIIRLDILKEKRAGYGEEICSTLSNQSKHGRGPQTLAAPPLAVSGVWGVRLLRFSGYVTASFASRYLLMT